MLLNFAHRLRFYVLFFIISRLFYFKIWMVYFLPVHVGDTKNTLKFVHDGVLWLYQGVWLDQQLKAAVSDEELIYWLMVCTLGLAAWCFGHLFGASQRAAVAVRSS